MKAYRNTMIAIAVIFVFSLIGVILNEPYFRNPVSPDEVVAYSVYHGLAASIFSYVALVAAAIVFIVLVIKNIRQFILKKQGKLPDDTYYEESDSKANRIFTDEEIAERKKENYISRAYLNKKGKY